MGGVFLLIDLHLVIKLYPKPEKKTAPYMRKRMKIKPWHLPFLGILIGILTALLFVESFTATWQYLGKPSDKVERIIGISGGHRVYVVTESEEIFSLEYEKYLNGGNSSFIKAISNPVRSEAWNKEEFRTIEPDPYGTPFMDFFVWPVLFEYKQMYEMPYLGIESGGLTRFALSENGNLWVWDFSQGGMAVLAYVLFPAIGLIIGSILFLGFILDKVLRKDK